MSDRIRSGIYFHGPRMRYSEVDQGRSGPKLLRLGSCDFDFDAEHALLAGPERQLDTIREAVGDVFSGSQSVDVSVVLSATSVISFFSPVSDSASEDEKRQQLEADTVLIGGHGSALSVVAEPVSTVRRNGDEIVTWYHVAAVPVGMRRRVSGVLSPFSDARHRFTTSLQAGARVAGRLESLAAESSELAASSAAAVGMFDSHTEISILRSGKWLFGSTLPSSLQSDVAYAILNLVDRSGVGRDDFCRIHTYGDVKRESDAATIGAATAAEVKRMNPLNLFRGGPVKEQHGFDPSDYALCVGAAL
ncbi:MAG: hypothetical protein R3178_00675 [Rhodothermales bacterium]|nr:hypothetical protein [Rhodothermales bacterium]